MFLKKLQLKNFRNYASQEALFAPGMNIITGDNAQGKTNLLDAILLTSLGKCHRAAKDKELIRWGEERASVTAAAEKRFGDETVEVVLDRAAGKAVAVNGMPVAKLGELMGVVATVLFSPDQMRIVKDAPGERRRFMDIALCQLSKPYFYLLNRYNRIVAQRNKLVKSGHASADALDVWDMQLAREGAKIVKTRRGFIARLGAEAADAHRFLSGEKETLTLSYEGIEGDDVKTAEENFLEKLAATRESDLKMGFTHVGPQRDDMRIEINGIDARTFGSQGQQRTAALSLKLAELRLARAETGESPILLLDDVLSELDPMRQRQLLSLVDVQTIITCTHISAEIRDTLSEFRLYKVVAGQLYDG